MPHQKSIQDRTKAVIAEILCIQESNILPSSRLQEDFGVDSLDQIELVDALEDEFDFILDNQTLKSINTVRELTTLVENTLAQTTP
jgi:acyl carrier protein